MLWKIFLTRCRNVTTFCMCCTKIPAWTMFFKTITQIVKKKKTIKENNFKNAVLLSLRHTVWMRWTLCYWRKMHWLHSWPSYTPTHNKQSIPSNRSKLYLWFSPNGKRSPIIGSIVSHRLSDVSGWIQYFRIKSYLCASTLDRTYKTDVVLKRLPASCWQIQWSDNRGRHWCLEEDKIKRR